MIKIEWIYDLYDILIKFVILSGFDHIYLFSYFLLALFLFKLKSTGTIDIEVAAKLALGAGKQEDLEQERLELQVTRMIYLCPYVRSERRRERETCFPASKKLIFNLNIIIFFSLILSATFSL